MYSTTTEISIHHNIIDFLQLCTLFHFYELLERIILQNITQIIVGIGGVVRLLPHS
jgi:hypothetical protein